MSFEAGGYRYVGNSISLQVCIAPVDPEREAGEYVCCDWEGDQERFEWK